MKLCSIASSPSSLISHPFLLLNSSVTSQCWICDSWIPRNWPRVIHAGWHHCSIKQKVKWGMWKRKQNTSLHILATAAKKNAEESQAKTVCSCELQHESYKSLGVSHMCICDFWSDLESGYKQIQSVYNGRCLEFLLGTNFVLFNHTKKKAKRDYYRASLKCEKQEYSEWRERVCP